ncbi:MAG: conserved repeat domain protein [Paenibacillaceae bacterium]|jgi:choice-of-anchor A domain-containing protein/uncharacterized repeat protein (TIGR01451 family)|nr:conserved repeat domain protein [Paenibacillaceae bacterium]
MACGNLGTAGNFNFFIFGNHQQSYNSSEGRMAIGGNATLQGYGIGDKLPFSTTRDDLIVAGNMDIDSGTNFNGNSIISPNGTVIRYTMTNNNGVRPQPLRGTPVDFAAEKQYLTCASSSWANVPANGTASNYYGQIRLTGTSPTLNVFTINGSNVAAGVALASANGVNFIVPSGSTILVNVSGTNVGFGSYSIFINGVTASQSDAGLILWNFYQATSAFNQNLSIKGTVLAPLAAWVSSGYGNIEGTLIANSYTASPGNLSGRNVPFAGCLPEVSCSPRLTIAKTVNGGSSASGPAGTPLQFQITVSNTGVGLLTNIEVADALTGLSQTIPSLTAGGQVVLNMESRIRAGSPGETYLNTATAVSSLTGIQSASVSITIEGTVDVEFVKTADRLAAKAGDTVTYRFSVINNGTLPLQNIRLTDPLLGIDTTFPSFDGGILATVPYIIPAGARAGSILSNTATLSAGNLPGTLTSRVDVEITETPSVSLVKTADRAEAFPGQNILYTITVTNDSQLTTLYNLTLSDPLFSFTQMINVLNPLASLIFNGMFLVPAGTPVGTVITNATVLQSSLGTKTASVNVTVGSAPALSIAKTPRSSSFAAGESAVYDIAVTNSGNIPLTNIVVEDSAASFSETVAALAIGQQANFVTQMPIPLTTLADTIVTNMATARSDQTGTVVAFAEIVVEEFFSLQLQKTVNTLVAAPGETFIYTLVVTNSSNAPVTNVQITDEALATSQVIDRLDAGAITRIQIPYQIPARTLAGTVVNNSSTVTSNETVSSTVSTEVNVGPAPSLSIQKSASQTSALPGQTVEYTVTVANTGNVALTDVRVDDPALGVSRVLPSLAAGASEIIVSPFVVPLLPPDTVIMNTAAAAASEITGSVTASAAINVGATPLPLVTKVSSVETAAPGEMVQFQVTVTNAAPVPLTTVMLSDSLVDLTDTFPVLLPGESKVYLLNYTIPEDARGGTVIVNTVTVSSDQTPFVSAAASVTVRSIPLLSASKTASPSSAELGQTIGFTINIVNEGNVDLADIAVSDSLLAFSTIVPLLATGSSLTFTLPFTIPETAVPGTIITNELLVTSAATPLLSISTPVEALAVRLGDFEVTKQSDVSEAFPGDTVYYTITLHNPFDIPVTGLRVVDGAAGFEETVSVIQPMGTVAFELPSTVPVQALAGAVVSNTVVVATDSGIVKSASAEVVVLPVPVLELSKSVSATSAIPAQTVIYTITAANTGNTVLNNVVIEDSVLAFSTVIPVLNVGESQSFSVPFVVPALPPGAIVVNFALAFSAETVAAVVAEASFSVGAAPVLLISKFVNPPSAVPGETVLFTILVTNPNGFSVTNVQISDSLLGWNELIPTLPSGFSKQILAPFTIPAGTPAGTVFINAVEVLSDQTLAASAQASLVVAPLPLLGLATSSSLLTARPNQSVDFTLTTANDGNVPLTNVFIRDPLLEIDEMIAVLAPSQQVTLTAAYAIPATALAGEQVFNTAIAGSDETPLQTAATGVTVAGVNSAVIVVTPSQPSVVPGNPITFTTEITNTSNQPLTNVVIQAELFGLIETVTSLGVGETIVLVTSYLVPGNARLDSDIVNIVRLTSNTTPLATANASVLVLPNAELGLIKQFPEVGLQGESVPYSLQVRNAGNITLNRIVLSDPLVGIRFEPSNLPVDSLQAFRGFVHIDRQTPIGTRIDNVATVSTIETGTIIEQKQLAVTGLSIVKSASSTVAFVGDQVQYRIVVANIMDYAAQGAVLMEELEPEVSFVAASVTVNGTVLPEAQVGRGIGLGNIAAGSSVTVTYSVRIGRVPRKNELLNQAQVTYSVQFPARLAIGTSVSNKWVLEVFEDEE